MMMDMFNSGTKRALATAALALTTVFSTGCATPGATTVGGAIAGGAIGNEVGGKLGAVLGIIAGAAAGSFAEPDCTTTVQSSQTRSVNGNSVGTWRGNEKMDTECNYSGNTVPGSFNAPSHLQHMQGNGNSNFRPY